MPRKPPPQPPAKEPKPPRPPRRGSVAYCKAQREAEDKAVAEFRVEQRKQTVLALEQAARKASERLLEILAKPPAKDEWGRLDPTYRAALDLALKGAGMLRDKVEVEAKGDAQGAYVFVVPPKGSKGD